jgi:predicted aldo/keto reductase-like oxidoreductase
MRHDGNSEQLVDYAISHGVNYFEACTFYLNGQCESIVRESLKKYPREQYCLCDKISILGTNFNGLDLEEFFAEQLQKCGVNYFDVYLLQALDRNCIEILNQYPIIEFFNRKREEGIIKNFGFSFHDTVDVLDQFLEMNQWDCVQMQLNYYDWYLGDAKAIYWRLTKLDIPIIVMGPLKGGVLTDKMPEHIQFAYERAFKGKRLSRLAHDFIRNLSGVKVVLTGAHTENQLTEIVKLYNEVPQKLQLRDKMAIETILNEYCKYNAIACTGCGYCQTVCPQAVDIKHLFAYYNNIISNTDKQESAKEYYKILKSPHSFFECRHCGQCERICPQHLPIQKIFNEKLFPMRL